MTMIIKPTIFSENQPFNSIRLISRGVDQEGPNSERHCIFTPKPKKRKVREETCSPFEDRSLTSLSLPSSDPWLSSEHQSEIFEFLQFQENRKAISLDYMKTQGNINEKMRRILIDWLANVSFKFELQPQVFPAAVHLIDRYLEKIEVHRSQLQLVGIASLMIVCKFEEVFPPAFQDYLDVCAGAFSRDDLLLMEGEILFQLDFDVLSVTCYNFFSLMHSKLNLDPTSFYFGQFLLENSLLHLRVLKYKSSVLAAGAIVLIDKIFDQNYWSHATDFHSLFEEEEVKKAALSLYYLLQATENTDQQALEQKFSRPEFLEVSTYSIQKIDK